MFPWRIKPSSPIDITMLNTMVPCPTHKEFLGFLWSPHVKLQQAHYHNYWIITQVQGRTQPRTVFINLHMMQSFPNTFHLRMCSRKLNAPLSSWFQPTYWDHLQAWASRKNHKHAQSHTYLQPWRIMSHTNHCLRVQKDRQCLIFIPKIFNQQSNKLARHNHVKEKLVWWSY